MRKFDYNLALSTQKLTVDIDFFDDFVKFLRSTVLAEMLHYSSQLPSGDVAATILIEDVEGLLEF